MWKELCEPYYLVVIGALLIALFAFGVGSGVGKLLAPILKKLSGKEGGVTVNVEPVKISEENPKPALCLIDPALCTAHKAEYERSKRNETQIEELWKHHGELKKEIMTELKSIREGQQKVLLALVSTGRVRPEDVLGGS